MSVFKVVIVHGFDQKREVLENFEEETGGAFKRMRDPRFRILDANFSNAQERKHMTIRFWGLTTFFCVIGLCGGPLLADKPPLQFLGNPIPVQPIKLAGIKKEHDGYRLTTPWMEYGEGGTGQTICQVTFAFDNFEVDHLAAISAFPSPVDGCANYGFDPSCGLGSARWFFGPDYCNMLCTNDMTVENCTAAGMAGRASWAWYWEAGGAGTSEQCLIAHFTAEDFDGTCVGFDLDGDGISDSGADHYYSGVIYDFGVLAGDAGGYYFTDIPDLCEFGLYHQLPLDGRGAYTLIFARAFDGATLTLATCAQPMLWGTKNSGTACENPASQGPFQWDDDSPASGTHEAPAECYSYAYNVCPNPLGATLTLYGDAADCCPADANCDGVVDNFDIDPLITTILNGSGCSCCAGDVNADGVIDFFDIDAGVSAILLGTCF